MDNPYIIFPLGDCAATIELGQEMSEEVNRKALAIQRWIDEHPWPGLIDSVIAYSSVTVFYDPAIVRRHPDSYTAFQLTSRNLQQAYEQSIVDNSKPETLARIPVCYDEEFGTDLQQIVSAKGLSVEEIIALHMSKIYRIYMLGFLPGFAYLGETDAALSMPRKQTPEQVRAGSIGIVSNQTGIYPLDSPGGWYIIGRTPVRLFDPEAKIPVKLVAGDQLQFYQISREEYDALLSSS